MNEDKITQLDRMRFSKNTTSANFCYLAILFDVIYFISIYESDVGSWYYQILIGASVLYNLIFLLAAFLCSEGIKNYKVSYSFLLVGLGIIQLARIFILPSQAHAATVTIKEVPVQVMSDGQFFRVCLYLAISAACLFAAAFVGYTKGKALADYNASLEAKAA